MQARSDHLELELPAEPGSVTRARHAAAELARHVGARVRDVEIAVSEAVGNAVIHAYPGAESGSVRLSGRVSRERLILVVADDGTGIRPDLSSRGLRMGLALIGRVVDDLRIEANRGGTTVSMSFALSGSSSTPPGVS